MSIRDLIKKCDFKKCIEESAKATLAFCRFAGPVLLVACLFMVAVILHDIVQTLLFLTNVILYGR